MSRVVNYTEVYRLAPGAVIPVSSWPPVILESTANGYDVPAVLNTIGSAVETELEWRWPAPYDGDARRARVRIERKARALERFHADSFVRFLESLPPGPLELRGRA